MNVALLSDFGWTDSYVGAMKGAILEVCSQARLVDLTHSIEPGDIASAARVLAQSAQTFPRGTVFLSVVDPGVGSARRGLAAEVDGHLHVAPDNGLLSRVLERAGSARAVALDRPAFWRRPDPSPVFHGRDVFAPVAGWLAAGGALDSLGPAIAPASLVRLAQAIARRIGDAWHGEVVSVDRFGNLATNLEVPAGARGRVELAGRALELCSHYAQVAPGELLALVGSDGRIEIAQSRGRAADLLGVAPGLLVVWRPLSGGSP